METMTAASSGLMVFLLVLAFTMSDSYEEEEVRMGPFMKFHVYIINRLSGGRGLSLHCKSKNNDLGTHFLGVETGFSWSFRENLFLTTRFWCYIRKVNGDDYARFDVFWPERHNHRWLSNRCFVGSCLWIVHDDGIYLFNSLSGVSEFIHQWMHGLE
jgi:hypothetical protein